MIKIIYIFADDWCGIYANNDLVIENYSIDFGYGMEFIAEYISDNSIEINQFIFEKYEIDQKWLEDMSNFPNDFSDIPTDILTEIK